MRSRLQTTLILYSLMVVLGSAVVATQAAAPATPQGFINFRTYAGDQRATVRTRTAVPDGSFYPKRAEGPYFGYPGPDVGDDDSAASDVRDNYNMELIGYFYPPKTGKIQLAISSDDPGELWLSTDDDPANKVQIATEPTWNNRRAYGTEDRRTRVSNGTLPADRLINQSPYINVVAGKPYFIQSIATEGGGGDNSSIAFRYEGDPDFADGDKPILGKYLSPFSLPAAPVIFSQPKDTAVYAGSTAVLSVALDAPPTVTITSTKWQKNGVDVPNSNALSLSVKTTAADDNTKYKAIIITSAGTLTSTEATLSVATFSNDFAPGVVKFEAWTGIGGTAVSGLLDDPHYLEVPDGVRLLTGIDTPNGYGDNYGARVTGFIIPSETGLFNFFLRSDDASQLFLSPNETPPDPAAGAPIAEETGCCDAFKEPGAGDETTVSPISLVAGKKYAFVAFVKEGGGGDYLQVAMRKVGDTTPAGSLRPLSGSQIGANARPNKGDPQITLQPVASDVQEGKSLSLSVDGIVVPAAFNFPAVVQWQKNGVNIPGATSKTYTIPATTPADAGTYRAVVSAPSGKSTNSLEVVAKIVSDKTPPTLAIALRSFKSSTKVLVSFSEPVSAATANTAANYKIDNGITVSAAAITSSAKTVELTTAALAAGTTYQLTVSGVQDIFGNPISASSSIAIGVQKGVFLVTADPGPLTFAGDNAINQHLLDRGFDVQLAMGSDVPDDGSTAKGRDLIIETSSLGSGTVEVGGIGKFRDLAIPAMNWEASSTDAFGFMEGNANPGTTAAQTAVNIVDPSSPLAAGFPKGLVTASASETYSQAQPVGAHIVATLATDPAQAIIFNYDKGEKGFGGFVMPARRVFFFFQDNTAAVATDAGWKLFDASVDWLLGIQAPAPPVGKPTLSVARTAAGLTLTFTGILQSADLVNGPWADVAGATSPRPVTLAGAQKFYRAKQ